KVILAHEGPGAGLAGQGYRCETGDVHARIIHGNAESLIVAARAKLAAPEFNAVAVVFADIIIRSAAEARLAGKRGGALQFAGDVNVAAAVRDDGLSRIK